MRPNPNCSIALICAVCLIQWSSLSQAAESDTDLAKVQGLWERKTGHDIPGLRRATKEVHGTHEVVTYFGDHDQVLQAHAVDFKVERREGIKIFTYFNWVSTAGPDIGHKSPAPVSYIYRADDNTFAEVWGFVPGQENRSPLVLMWVRKIAPSAAVQKEQQALAGNWQADASLGGGGPVADVLGDQFQFSGDDLTVRRSQRSRLKAVFRLDPSKEPKQIELIITQSPDGMWDGQTIRGIYQLQGDTLRWCSSLPNHPRPQGFSPVEGSSQTSIVLRRSARSDR